MLELEALQRRTAQAVTASVADVMDGEWGNRVWLRIVVNYETLLHTADPQTSDISFSIARHEAHPLEIVDFRLSRAARDEFKALSESCHALNGEYWTSCDLIIEQDGRYRFDFSYGPPYRLSGHIHDQRFDDYLQRYPSTVPPQAEP